MRKFTNIELFNQIRENATLEFKDKLPFLDDNGNPIDDDTYWEIKNEKLNGGSK